MFLKSKVVYEEQSRSNGPETCEGLEITDCGSYPLKCRWTTKCETIGDLVYREDISYMEKYKRRKSNRVRSKRRKSKRRKSRKR